jgi:hypothetical protein
MGGDLESDHENYSTQEKKVERGKAAYMELRP